MSIFFNLCFFRCYISILLPYIALLFNFYEGFCVFTCESVVDLSVPVPPGEGMGKNPDTFGDISF